MITIAVINKAKTPLGVDLDALIASMQIFVDAYLAPAWAVSCKLVKTSKPVKGAWHFLFLDNADVQDALGYHDYVNGMPVSKIFVETTINDGQLVSVTATHELAEMLVDPDASQIVKGPKKLNYAKETADAVEETDFPIHGIRCTNFILPTWFQNFKHPAGTKFDYLGLCKRPFELLSGGYAAVQKSNGQWTQIFGSQAKAQRFKKEDRREHRVETLIFKEIHNVANH